jgi:hypothetical protein
MLSTAIQSLEAAGLVITCDNSGEPVYCTLHGKQLRYIGKDTDGGPIFCGIVEMDPAFAQANLKNMNVNRTLNKPHVEALASDMLNSRWQLTGETIIFDVDGLTTDSQHRNNAYLKACEINGSPLTGILMTAVAGVSKKSMLVLDSGKKRSVTDSARISGALLRSHPEISITSKHQQLVKAIPELANITTSELVELIQKFADPIEYAIMAGQKGGNCYCTYPCARVQIMLAAIEYRNNELMLEKLESFKYLFDGEYVPETFDNQESFKNRFNFDYSHPDAWPLCLRHEIEVSKGLKRYGGSTRKEFAAKAIKALRAYLQGEDGPGTNSQGARKPIPSGLSREELFNTDLRSLPAWNDNSFRSLFTVIEA